jgi:molybdopterin-guanine dinucleotide biosynthesis protein A
MEMLNTAVILAGGKSQRMGFDKQFLRINEKNLMRILISKLRKQFKEIIVVTNKPEGYVGLCDKIVSDEIVGLGPLSGIHIGLKASSSKYAYFLACDMPNINFEYIDYMKNKIRNSDYDVCITRFGEWIEPFNAFYSKNIVDKIEDHLLCGKRSIYSLIKGLNTCFISEEEARRFSPNWEMFCNLNTEEDLEQYIKNAAL